MWRFKIPARVARDVKFDRAGQPRRGMGRQYAALGAAAVRAARTSARRGPARLRVRLRRPGRAHNAVCVDEAHGRARGKKSLAELSGARALAAGLRARRSWALPCSRQARPGRRTPPTRARGDRGAQSAPQAVTVVPQPRAHDTRSVATPRRRCMPPSAARSSCVRQTAALRRNVLTVAAETPRNQRFRRRRARASSQPRVKAQGRTPQQGNSPRRTDCRTARRRKCPSRHLP